MSDDVIVVPIFSRGRPGPIRVHLPAGRTGLPHDSVLFCEEVTTLDLEFIEGGPHGQVPSRSLEEVVVAIRRAVGDFTR